MLSAKIVSLKISDVKGLPKESEAASVTAILDINTLLDKAQKIYRYIARERMVGLPTDMGFDKPGEETAEVPLPDGTVMKIYPEGYSSFLLLPLLTSFINGRIVMLGDPGLGKTQMATLMGQMMGLPISEVEAGMVNGHPQLTIADLFGNLDLAEYAKGNIKPVWRKIVDSWFHFVNEFNRIPTKTQSALLSALAEGFVNIFNDTREVKRGPWFFTANEANGGGTYQVIAALWDRIDASVRATPVNAHDLKKAREIDNKEPFPEGLTLSEQETQAIGQRIDGLPVEEGADKRLTYFLSQLNACEPAADDVSHRFKSHIVEGGKRGDALWSSSHDDPAEYIGAQLENTVGTRIYFSIIRYARALAWFRGKEKVETEDIAAVLPAVMSHRIKPNRSAQAEDRWAWVSKIWQKAMDRYDERERDADRLSYTKLVEKLKTVDLKDQPGKITAYMEQYAQAMDGSAGIEDLLAMKTLYEETMRKVRDAKITPTVKPKPPNPPGPPRGSTGKILMPEQILEMHRAGRTPPIGSFVRLAGGEVKIGNTFDGEGSADEKPAHTARLSPFLLSLYSVTNAEFRQFMEARGYSTDRFWSEEGKQWRDAGGKVQPQHWEDARFNQPNQPVVGVSWYEAEAYLKWAGQRFPTEHEREYAARGGLVGKRYPWGDENPARRAHFGHQDGSTGAAVEVNSRGFAPNNFGMYHPAGNVWEWVGDWYDQNYYQTLTTGRTLNPPGPVSGTSRVLRGGSWGRSAGNLRVALRYNYDPFIRNFNFGFRAARTL